MAIPGRIVILTDLDGTLLEGLDLIKRLDIPLVLCSSKTRAEIELLQVDLRIRHPFISENGGALFVPRGYFSLIAGPARDFAGYHVMDFGRPYSEIVTALHAWARRAGVEVVGFSDMTVEEVARECNLTLLEARLAKLREYDEPFRFLDAPPAGSKERIRFFDALHRAGWRCTREGRFHHLTGVVDRGLAIRRLKRLFERNEMPVTTVGLGHSLNDLSLLQQVDLPVIVRNPAADAAEHLLRKVPKAWLTTAEGSDGWNEAIQKVLSGFAAVA